MEKENNSFSGEITVSSRIIDDLSSGLYTTPAACLKELVNNSYDARATIVNIFVKPDADRIIVEDNGDGISKDEFVRHFKRVSESYKRNDADVTEGKPPKGGRPKIGKIGIGFIAANELCEILEIYSTKKDSEELLHITIDFREMRKPIQERRRGSDDIVKADYVGEILQADKDAHYTQLFLTEVRGTSKQIMASAKSQNENSKTTTFSLYGLKSETVAELLKDTKISSWKEFDSYSETMLNVGLNVPVKYHENWIPNEYKNFVKEFETVVSSLGFEVFYDGTELRKPIVFNPPDEYTLIDYFEYSGKLVSAKGYFYAQHTTVKPFDLQGLLIRIRQAAVGEFDHTFWGFSPNESPIIQRWVSAEIWADDKLEDAMNIDRKNFRTTHPAYVELRQAIHNHLRLVLKKATKQLYEAGSVERKKERTDKLIKSVQSVVKEVIAPISAKAAINVSSIVQKSVNNKVSLKSLERKYSVAEFYETVIEVAKEVLPPAQQAKFLERLTERLGNGK